jgi:hypothetical protein
LKRALDYGVGVAVVVLLYFLLTAGLSEPSEGLHGELKGQGPYLVGPQAQDVEIGPPTLFDRLQEKQWGNDALRLTTWSVSYGSRWHRAITVPMLRGPLDEEGKSWCGIAARISPGVLDPAQSGEGLLELVRSEMNKVLPLTLPCGFTRNVYLARPKKVSLKMTPRDGVIDLEVVADLPDGTKVGAASTIRLVANPEGHLIVDHIGPVKPLFAGPARAQCEGTLKVQLGQLYWRYIKGQRGSIVLATARAEMSRQIKPALDALNASISKLHEPMRPFPDHDVEMALRLARPPTVSKDGIELRLCASVQLGGSRVDPAITGPPLVRAELPEMPPPADGARIDVNLNAEAVNRMVYVLWQIGELRRWGKSTEILDRLPDEVKALAFEVTGFDPRLPPIIDATRSRVTAANIAVGTWGQRTVLGHATGKMRLKNEPSRVVMTAEIDELGVSCVEQDGRAWRLTPCLSELLPIVREGLASQPPRFSLDTSGLVRSIAGHTLHGLSLELSPPTVELQKGMLRAQMSVKVGAVTRSAPP